MVPPDARLSDNFWLREFLRSEEHPGLAQQLNPSLEVQARLELLSRSLLQPVRDRWGPWVITSGFRSAALNAAVGGAQGGDHRHGMAADGYPKSAKIARVYRWIVRKNFPYRQCIWYPDRGILHLSINVPGREYRHDHWVQKDSQG